MCDVKSIPCQGIRWKIEPLLLLTKCRRNYPSRHAICCLFFLILCFYGCWHFFTLTDFVGLLLTPMDERRGCCRSGFTSVKRSSSGFSTSTILIFPFDTSTLI